MQGLSDQGIWNGLKQTFVKLNQQFKQMILSGSGTTAVIAMIIDGKIWVANLGDSRAVLSNGGSPIQLSEDAKPRSEGYQNSIVKRGGFVSNSRVGGILSVARTIGDPLVQGVSARPKITNYRLSDIRDESHQILACDGVYDVASTRQVVDKVYRNRNESAEELVKMIVRTAYSAMSSDNLSALIVKF